MSTLNSEGRRWSAVVLSSLVAAGGITAVAAAETVLPKVPTSFETDAHDLAVKPKSILVSQDGNASVWGPNSRGFKGESHFPHEPGIHWTRWTARDARAGIADPG